MYHVYMMTSKDAVRAIRSVCGENQQIFATKIGLAIRSLAFYESGEREPDIRALYALLKRSENENQPKLADHFRSRIRICLGESGDDRIVI